MASSWFHPSNRWFQQKQLQLGISFFGQFCHRSSVNLAKTGAACLIYYKSSLGKLTSLDTSILTDFIIYFRTKWPRNIVQQCATLTFASARTRVGFWQLALATAVFASKKAAAGVPAIPGHMVANANRPLEATKGFGKFSLKERHTAVEMGKGMKASWWRLKGRVS